MYWISDECRRAAQTKTPRRPPQCLTQFSASVLMSDWVWLNGFRGAIFGKISNQNQTDTNEMAITEAKYQTDFYSAKNTNI